MAGAFVLAMYCAPCNGGNNDADWETTSWSSCLNDKKVMTNTWHYCACCGASASNNWDCVAGGSCWGCSYQHGGICDNGDLCTQSGTSKNTQTYYYCPGTNCATPCNPNTIAGCDAACNTQTPVCGDGIINLDWEECDDGNNLNGDGCSNECKKEAPEPYCGDGTINLDWEECDDGNNLNGDGCSNECKKETPKCINVDKTYVVDANLCDGAGISSCPNSKSVTINVPYEGKYIVHYNVERGNYPDGNCQCYESFKSSLNGQSLIPYFDKGGNFCEQKTYSDYHYAGSATLKKGNNNLLVEHYYKDNNKPKCDGTWDTTNSITVKSIRITGTICTPITECKPGQNKTIVCGQTNVGECKMGTKTRTCNSKGFWGNWDNCLGATYPVVEVCDGEDNDCDGQTDEDGVCCGNGKVETGEECDDGNNVNGDGCNSTCKKEDVIIQCNQKPAKLFTPEGNSPCEPLDMEFDSVGDEVLIFSKGDSLTNGKPSMTFYVNDKKILNYKILKEKPRIYLLKVQDGDSIRIVGFSGHVTRNLVQGVITQYSYSPQYDIDYIDYYVDDKRGYKSYLDEGTYKLIYFDKYTHYNCNSDDIDDRTLNVDIYDPNKVHVLDVTHTKPTPSEGVVVQEFEAKTEGYHTINTSGEDSIFYMAAICYWCGNGILEPGEECDDGNRNSGDRCSADCKNEKNPVRACPEDAKVCPDGTRVVRSGLNCEFAKCPIQEKEYAPSYDINSNNRQVLTLNDYKIKKQENTKFSNRITVNMPKGYIYKEGYYLTGTGWKKFTFDEATSYDSNWIADRSTKRLEINTRETGFGVKYIAVYTCNKYDGEWKCGCDETGKCGKWMIISYDVEQTMDLPPEPTIPRGTLQ